MENNKNVKTISKDFVRKINNNTLLVVTATLYNYILKQNENIIKVTGTHYTVNFNKEGLLNIKEGDTSTDYILSNFPEFKAYHQEKTSLIEYITIVPKFLQLVSDIVPKELDKFISELVAVK